MELFIVEKRPPSTITLTLERMPKAVIRGPGELKNGVYFEIQSKGQKVHIEVDPETGDTKRLVYEDPNARNWAMLTTWIAHPLTEWNLGDKDGNVLPRTPETLDDESIFTPGDTLEMIGQLFDQLWSQTDPEGNSPASPSSDSHESPTSDDSSAERTPNADKRTGSSKK